MDCEFEKSILQHQKEVENHERKVVGLNCYVSPPEHGILPGGILRVAPHSRAEQVAKVKSLKENRNGSRLRNAIKKLRQGAERGEGENLIPYVTDAVRAYGTVEEIMGTIREAYGYGYAPLGVRTSPF